MDYEHIINVYRRAYKRALAAGDLRAEDYGRRLTHWIQVWESNGGLEDTGSAFSMGRYSERSNVLVLS